MRALFAAALIGAPLFICGADAQELTGTLKKIKDSKTVILGYRASSIPFSYLNRPGDDDCQHHTVHALYLLLLRDRLRSSASTAARMEKGHPGRDMGRSSTTVKKVSTKCNGNLGNFGKMGRIGANKGTGKE